MNQKNLQHQDLNVLPILNVPTTLHAFKRNVKTLALPLLVESMLNAELLGIEQHVIVDQVMKEILIAFAKNVSKLIWSISDSFGK